MKRATKPLATRFWGKVEKTPTCWLWTASITGAGYGQIGLGRKGDGRGDSHRISWMLHNGSIPNGQQVLHQCDNKRCVNPAHLYLGTRFDNIRDALERGQKATGSSCSFAKLKAEDVPKVRQLRKEGWTFSKLAAEFNVSQSVVKRVVYEVSYRNN